MAIWCSASAPDLRRQAREAARVLVVVRAGKVGAATIASSRTRLGVDDVLAFAIFGVGPELANIRDRVGDWDTGARVETSSLRATSERERHA